MFKRFTRLYFLVLLFVLFTACTANAQWVRMTDGLPTSLSIKATLVNERLQPGTYVVKFDGSMLDSGVYFYKLMTDGFTETKKMILIK